MTYVNIDGELHTVGGSLEEHWTTAAYEEHGDHIIRVFLEEYAGDFANPRECDNLGTMVCWHPDYTLGDYQLDAARGSVSNPFDRSDFKSMNHLARYLSLVKGALVVLPLYLYDHSGISMRVGNTNTVDSYWQHSGWDTTMVGFIYTTPERVKELCGDGPHPNLCEALTDEVSEYDAYLRGEVYGFEVLDATTGETQDSCSGYLGASGLECAKQEALSFLPKT